MRRLREVVEETLDSHGLVAMLIDVRDIHNPDVGRGVGNTELELDALSNCLVGPLVDDGNILQGGGIVSEQ